jgi:hypothetical protein
MMRSGRVRPATPSLDTDNTTRQTTNRTALLQKITNERQQTPQSGNLITRARRIATTPTTNLQDITERFRPTVPRRQDNVQRLLTGVVDRGATARPPSVPLPRDQARLGGPDQPVIQPVRQPRDVPVVTNVTRPRPQFPEALPIARPPALPDLPTGPVPVFVPVPMPTRDLPEQVRTAPRQPRQVPGTPADLPAPTLPPLEPQRPTLERPGLITVADRAPAEKPIGTSYEPLLPDEVREAPELPALPMRSPLQLTFQPNLGQKDAPSLFTIEDKVATLEVALQPPALPPLPETR